MKLILIVLGVLLALLVTGAMLVGPELSGALTSFETTAKGTRVRLVEATQDTLVETVKAPGEIEPRTKVDISAEISAKVRELPFEEGNRVSKGDVVVRLFDDELRAAHAMAEARRDGEQFRLQAEQSRLAGLQSNYEFAKRELERKQNLYESNDVSLKDLDAAQERVLDLKSTMDSTKYQISVIESSLTSAKADILRAAENLSKTVIIAPMDGVVTQLNAEVGEVVLVGTMNNPGTVVMTIADLSRMVLNARINEHDIAKVVEGQPAHIHTITYGDNAWSGVVTKIALQRSGAADGTGYFKTEIEIDMQGRELRRGGITANVDVETERHEGVIVPFQSVVERLIEELPAEVKQDNELIDFNKRVTTVVYREVDGKAVCTPVVPGPSDDLNRLVKRGLKAGDRVIAGPYKMLDGESRVKHGDRIVDELEADGDESDANAADPDPVVADDDAADPKQAA